MSRLWILFLSMSLSGALLILVLLLCKPLYKDKISKKWQYYIWLVVIAKLLLPLTPKVNLVEALPRQTGAEGQMQMENEEDPESKMVEDQKGYLLKGDLTTPVMEAEVPVGAVIVQNLWIIWLAGAAIFLMRKITIYQSFVKYVKAGCQEVSDVILLDRLSELEEQVGIKHPVELYANSWVSSPMLLGFFHPCIILPDTGIPREEFGYTIRHELIHYKRRDMFYKWLMQITVCLHWFNPLVYRMAREMDRDCELSLDEAVISHLGMAGRTAYGDTLFHAMGVGGKYSDPLSSAMLGESAELLKERLEAIMNYKEYTKGMKLMSFALTSLFLAGAMAVGVYASPAGQDAVGGREEKGSGSLWAGAEDGRASDYARQCYQEKNLPQFMMFFTLLSQEEQELYLEKFYEEDQIAYFSAAVSRLDSHSTQIQAFAEKAYEDHSVSFFSVLAGCMGETDLEAWLSRAVNDRRIGFQAAILQAGKEDGELKELEEKLEAQQMEEYQAHGITREGMIYYYQGQTVGILMDLKADSSFITLDMNPEGVVNIRIMRDESGMIKDINYMSEEEVEELLGGGLEEDTGFEEGIIRLEKEEAPPAVQAAIDSCEDGEWHVIADQNRQFIYFNGLPHNYAYWPEFGRGTINIEVIDTGALQKTYVLLSLPADLELRVGYNGKEVNLENF